MIQLLLFQRFLYLFQLPAQPFLLIHFLSPRFFFQRLARFKKFLFRFQHPGTASLIKIIRQPQKNRSGKEQDFSPDGRNINTCHSKKNSSQHDKQPYKASHLLTVLPLFFLLSGKFTILTAFRFF